MAHDVQHLDQEPEFHDANYLGVSTVQKELGFQLRMLLFRDARKSKGRSFIPFSGGGILFKNENRNFFSRGEFKESRRRIFPEVWFLRAWNFRFWVPGGNPGKGESLFLFFKKKKEIPRNLKPLFLGRLFICARGWFF